MVFTYVATGISKAVNSVVTATLAANFSTTTANAWVSTGLSVTPASGNYAIIHALTFSSATIAEGYGFGFGAAPNFGVAFGLGSVSVASDSFPGTFQFELSAPDGVTAQTLYASQNGAGTLTLNSTQGFGGSVKPATRLLAVTYN